MDWRKFEFKDNRYIILRTIKTYERTDSGKSWKKNPSEVEQDIQSPEFYTNYITSIPFFNNWGDGAYCRGHYTYTIAGYLPTTVITVSPFQTVKKVAEFRFIYRPDLEESAGWREQEVLKNATEFNVETYQKDYGVHRRIEFINPKESGVTHSATWDTYGRKWVN